jgi:hypothetical protein
VVIFFNFQAPMLGGWRGKKLSKNDFGYAANLEIKFKLNFDEENGSKIENKVKIPKNTR